MYVCIYIYIYIYMHTFTPHTLNTDMHTHKIASRRGCRCCRGPAAQYTDAEPQPCMERFRRPSAVQASRSSARLLWFESSGSEL